MHAPLGGGVVVAQIGANARPPHRDIERVVVWGCAAALLTVPWTRLECRYITQEGNKAEGKADIAKAPSTVRARFNKARRVTH